MRQRCVSCAIEPAVEAIPEQECAAIRQIANVTGNQNVTPQVAGSRNVVNVGQR